MNPMASNLHVIDADDWRVFAIKMMDKLPGTTMTAKKEWLKDRTDIGLSTTQTWIQSGEGQKPSLENLTKISTMLGLSGLIELVLLVQTRGDCPAPKLSPVNQHLITALAEISPADIALIAQRLGGLTSKDCYRASTNLMLLADHLP
jgi:hypothetical protein